jgi:hypothetical protein
MYKTERFGMFHMVKIKKDKEFGFGIDITKSTRDGELFILIKQARKEPQDLTVSMDSISTD